jgi:hypothetical protein
MTVFENMARHFPLHLQRICELTQPKRLLCMPSRSKWADLAGLFLFVETPEGYDYWDALATGNGLQ